MTTTHSDTGQLVRNNWRLFLGGVLSCLVLTAIAIGATLAGHGTYAPIIFVVSFVYFFGCLHPVIAIAFAPIYWGMVFVWAKGNKQRVFIWLLLHSAGFIVVSLVEKDHFSLQKIESGINNVAIFLAAFFLTVLFLLKSRTKKS